MADASLSEFRIAAFGSLHVSNENSSLTLRSRKHLALLVFLAVEHGRAHSRSTLVALLWPDMSEDAARNNLRVALADLRRSLGDAGPGLQTDRMSVQLLPGSHVLDVTEHEALLAAVRTHPHADVASCDACSALLVEAASLYRGEFLHGFILPDSANFEEWATVQRERLRLAQLDVLQMLAVARERRNDPAGQVAYGRQLLDMEPWREAAHDLVIRGLWAAGQRGAALKQYYSYRRILADELGLPPAPELAALAERLRSESHHDTTESVIAMDGDVADVHADVGVVTDVEHGRPDPGRETATGRDTARSDRVAPIGPAGAIPAALSALVGREHELAELLALISRTDVRIVTIVGVGGIGKTRLSQELGRASAAEFADGVCFVPLAPLADPSAIAPAVLGALDENPAGDPVQTLLASLRGRRLLLILDNFEHLLGGAELVSAIAEAAPHVTVLATSRERLHLRGEHQFLLSGLSVGSVGTGGAGDSDSPALRLFVERARHLQPGFVVADDNNAAVQRICELVDGMPLAIELAATWLEMLGPADIAAEIAHNLDFLRTEWRDLPPRQRSMRAVFDWSWNLLDDTEKQVLRRLAFFRGGFTRDAARDVAGASLIVLNRLMQKALVRASNGNRSGRYELHELLRQFALEEAMRHPSDAAATLTRHLAYYVKLAERSDPSGPQTESEAWLTDVERDHENIRAALTHSLQGQPSSEVFADLGAGLPTGDNAELGLRLAASVWPFWRRHCLLQEGRDWIERLLANLPDATPTPYVRAAAYYGAAWLAHDQDDFPGADAFFAAGLALDQDLGHTDRVASVLVHRGIMARGQGQYGEAIALVEQGLKLSREAGHLEGIAFGLFRLGVVTRECAQFGRAEGIYNECQVVYRALDDPEGQAFVLLGLADLARDEGNVAELHASNRAALAIGRELKQPWIMGFGLNNKALGMLMEGQTEGALQASEEALALFGKHDIRGGVVEALVTSGMIAVTADIRDLAHARLSEAVRRGWPAGPHWLVATGVEELARHAGPTRTAAVLFATCEAWRAVMGAPVPPYRRPALEAAIVATRRELGEEQFAAAWSEGATMATDQAVGLALGLAIGNTTRAMPSVAEGRAIPGLVDVAAVR